MRSHAERGNDRGHYRQGGPDVSGVAVTFSVIVIWRRLLVVIIL